MSTVSQKMRSDDSAVQFADNRPEVVNQKNPQGIAEGPITIETMTDFDKLTTGLKNGAGNVKKVRKEGTHWVYTFNDKLYRLSLDIETCGLFDTASGSRS